jgi:di/tripeptidase
MRIIGDRPTGRTPGDARLVLAARAATRQMGQRAELVAGSTDANVPMALGIEAIAIGAGGEAGGTHTTGEWFRNDGGPAGMARALLTVLLAAGVR